MSLTININNLTLAHKGSNGTAIATVPDVCKTPTPSGPMPMPYPNIAQSSDLMKGTTTVKADGGNMIANQGSELARSTGDEPGTAGGITSSTFIKEATWLTYSFDVKMEGKGACRLTDKMLMNHGNTVCCGGFLQKFLAGPKGPSECAELLKRIETIIGEGMTGKTDGIRGLEERMKQQVTGKGGPGDAMDRPPSNEFPNGSNPWTRHDREIQTQQDSLEKHLDAYDKHCKGGPPPPPKAREWVKKPRPAPSDWKGPSFNWAALGWGAAAVGLTVLTAAAILCPFDGPAGDVAAGSAAASAWGSLALAL